MKVCQHDNLIVTEVIEYKIHRNDTGYSPIDGHIISFKSSSVICSECKEEVRMVPVNPAWWDAKVNGRVTLNYKSEEEIISERMGKILNTKVSDLFLSVRSQSVCKQSNIITIGQLVQMKEKDVLSLQNAGRKTLNELKEILSDYGMSFGMKIDYTYKGE